MSKDGRRRADSEPGYAKEDTTVKTLILTLILGAWAGVATADVPLNPGDVVPWEHLIRRLEQANVPTDTASLIEAALAHPDFAVRSAAVQVLGLRQEITAEAPLMKILSTDEERLVREDAAIALVRLGHRGTLEQVREFMRTESSRHHQVQLAGQLAEFGDFSGYPLAVQAASAEDEGLRQVATGVISRFLVAGLREPQGLPAPSQVLLGLLNDEDTEVRQRSVLQVGIAVGQGSDASSFIESVRRLSEEDPDADVRRTAQGVLLSLKRLQESRGKDRKE